MTRPRFLIVAALAALVGGAAPASAKPKLPPIGHVFTIVLENKDYDVTFGDASPTPYLAKALPAKGQLLTDYYGTGHASLGNYLTLISGQSENPTTQGDCIFVPWADMSPGTIGAYGQAQGSGCVFGPKVLTVGGQLEDAGLTWRAYMEDMGNDPVRDGGKTCAHPPVGGTDGAVAASAQDQYATRHNPFVYFHSVIDKPASCPRNDVNLDQLAKDLKKPKTTPNYSFIAPDLCSDGHDVPCADPSQQGGYAGIDAFLREWVPRILKSKAFKQDGLLVVAFDESDNKGQPSQATACCFVPNGPNVAAQGGAGPGGGKVGAIAISPFIDKGTVNKHPYNHYDYLHTVDDIFGLKYLGYAAHPAVESFGPDVFGR